MFGMLALGSARDEFASAISGYFQKWIDALLVSLEQAGIADPRFAAHEIIASIQGAIVLARAPDDAEQFKNAMIRIRNHYIPDYRNT